MRHLPIFIILLMLSLIPLQMWGNNFSGIFMPETIQVNEISVATFDPENAASQPFITSFTIQNISQKTLRLRMKVNVNWNGKELFEMEFESREPLAASETIFLSNSELFTNAANDYFTLIDFTHVSINDIIKISPTLKQSLLSGYFPDGTIQASISLKDAASSLYEAPSTFTLEVQNTGSITLFSPGQSIGSKPPKVSMKPLSFLWSAVNTGFNKAWITIREFPQMMPPSSNTVALSGSLFYETPDDVAADDLINSFLFSDHLAFNDGNYYAWQITMDRFTERNILAPSKRSKENSSLKSEWYVFQYVTDDSTLQNEDELKALLLTLNNDGINSLISQGYSPAGNVILNGRNYLGFDAVRLLDEIIDKELEIRVGK